MRMSSGHAKSEDNYSSVVSAAVSMHVCKCVSSQPWFTGCLGRFELDQSPDMVKLNCADCCSGLSFLLLRTVCSRGKKS